MQRRRWVSAGFSVALHAGLALALFAGWSGPRERTFEPLPVDVAMVDASIFAPPAPPAPEPSPTPADAPEPAPEPAVEPKPEPPKAAPPKPPPIKAIARPTPRPPPREMATISAGDRAQTEGEASDPGLPGLSEAALAGAARAGSGSGGGGGGGSCDMVRRLEDSLRKSARVRAAVAQARHAAGPDARAVLVWNGDWLRSRGEAGPGLATVREAMIIEIYFAPEACRAQPVRGLVLLALDDQARLALGHGAWRWSDLLKRQG